MRKRDPKTNQGSAQCEPDANQSEPKANQKGIRGVRLIERPGRPNPYGVQWREKIWNEKRGRLVSAPKTLFFPTSAARDEKAGEMRSLRRGRMLVASISRAEIEEYRAIKAAIEEAPWQNVVAGWRAHLMSAGLKPCILKVEQAVKEYLEESQRLNLEGKLSPDTYRHKRHKLTLFAEQFGHLTLDAVTAREIETWIDDFDEVGSDYTFDNYRKYVSALYGHFVASKTVRDNPCAQIKGRSDGIGEVRIISVAQAAQLFHTALNYRDEHGDAKFMPAIGRLAMEAFVGLRFSSGCRLEKSDINFADHGVLLPKRKLKTKRRHYIDGMPDNVWTWLKITPEDCWHLSPRLYMELKSQLFEEASIPHPHNCLRHSFATYHVAAFKNPGLTAYLLCHRNQDLLWEHYKGNAKDEEGKAYFTITPQTAERLAKGFESAKPRDVR